MTDSAPDDLRQVCAEAMCAFALASCAIQLEINSPSLVLLKQDDLSLVVKALCSDTKIPVSPPSNAKLFVLKCVREDLYSGSEATANIERVLTAGSSAAQTDSAETSALIPCRRQTIDGKYLYRQAFEDKPAMIWSVSDYISNSPSFDWLDTSATWTAGHAKSAGELLARVHRVAYQRRKEFVDKSFGDLPTVVESVPGWLTQALSADSQTSYGHTILTPEVKKHLLAQITEVTYELTAGAYSADINSEMTAIHGDFQPGNVLYKGETAVHIIDWDYAHFDHPLLDVAYGLIMFGGKLACSKTEVINTTIANAFLDGYRLVSPTDGFLPPGPLAATLQKGAAGSSDGHRNAHGLPDASGLLTNYIKLAASLIMLWTFSEQGKSHPQSASVLKKVVRLILS